MSDIVPAAGVEPPPDPEVLAELMDDLNELARRADIRTAGDDRVFAAAIGLRRTMDLLVAQGMIHIEQQAATERPS